MYIGTDILSDPMNRLGEYVHTYVYLFCIVCCDAVFNYTCTSTVCSMLL